MNSAQQLILDTARRQGANLAVAMATVEAETNFRNIRGAYGRESAAWGAGFGQVHPAWHADDVRDVAARLRIQLPEGFGPVPWAEGNQVWDRYRRRDPAAIAVRRVIDMILRDDRFSAELSVQVIQKIWEGTGQDFDRYLRAYVGPGIPAADIARRRRMLDAWRQRLATMPAPARPAQTAPPGVTPVAAPATAAGAAAVAALAGKPALIGIAILALAIAWQRGVLKDIEREDALDAIAELQEIAETL